MRMRFKPYARPELLATPWHAHEPAANKGCWRSQFARPELPRGVARCWGTGGCGAGVGGASGRGV